MSLGMFYIYTFGCQMNVHDSEQMAKILCDAGYMKTSNVAEADIIIVNTCSVREKAAHKVYSYLGRLKKLKKQKPDLIMGVAGCLAQEHGKAFFSRIPYLDLVIGTHNIHRIAELTGAIKDKKTHITDTTFHKSVRSMGIRIQPPAGSVSSFVTIMQGCNNFCSYCIVPYVRGREESRPSRDIVAEVVFLAGSGIKEVVLLGQNVNSYGSGLSNNVDFPSLLRMINGIDGIERIRFTTSHPKDLSRELASCFSDLDKVCEHIHLPAQSGSNDVLKKMKRGYTVEDYMSKISMLRDMTPDIGITTDIIVGFPGEKESDFQKTIDLIEKVRFDNIFSFRYCDRHGTVSEGYDDKITEEVKQERLAILQSLQEEYTLKKNKSLVGRVESVLVEGTSKSGGDDISGRTRDNKIVNFAGDSGLIGNSVSVKIVRAHMHSLRGEKV